MYEEDYTLLLNSGLYQQLTQEGLLLPHEESNLSLQTDEGFKIIKPDQLHFISSPSEWCFSQLKDAALLTLTLMREAISKGMILKDARPDNIQLHKGRLLLIDTLSFTKYKEALPWIAYRQFCESFLAPLVLMHYAEMGLSSLFLAYPEGIPLSLTSKLLPLKTKFNLHLYLHIHLNAKYAGGKTKNDKSILFSEKKMLDLISSLESAINNLELKGGTAVWSNYYEEAKDRKGYLEEKEGLVSSWAKPFKRITDLGANEGHFSILVSGDEKEVVSADLDHFSIDRLYRKVINERKPIYPIVLDLSYPTPSLGMHEGLALKDRINTDLVIALALIHHLVLGKSIPMLVVANYLAKIAPALIIEFVEEDDNRIIELRQFAKGSYSRELFEESFNQFFELKEKAEFKTAKRSLYFFERKSALL